MKKLCLVFGGVICAFCFLYVVSAFAEWPVKAELFANASPLVADLNKDGYPEIVTTESTNLVCRDMKGEEIWRYNPNSGYLVQQTQLSDLNGDGLFEIIASAWNEANTTIICLNNQGRLLWQYKTEEGSVTPLVAADFNADNKIEILILGRTTGMLYCLDNNGKKIWKSSRALGGRYPNIFYPAAADLDKDGKLEMVIQTDDYTGSMHVDCIDDLGSSVWSYTVKGAVYGNFAPVLSDINGDGGLEVLVMNQIGAFDRKKPCHLLISCLNQKGQLLWERRFDDFSFIHGYAFWGPSCLSVADVDGNGSKEIIVPVTFDREAGGSVDGVLYCLDNQGQDIWEYSFNNSPVINPIVADINGDGEFEIIATAYSFAETDAFNSVYCMNKSGQVIWKEALPGRAVVFNDRFTEMAVADLDGNGSLEIIGEYGLLGARYKYGYSLENYIYCLDSDGNLFVPSRKSSVSDKAPFLLARKNLQRTGVYMRDTTGPSTPSIIPEAKRIGNKDVACVSWASIDNESGVNAYRYRIIDSVSKRIISNWRVPAYFNYVVLKELGLKTGDTCSIEVRAQNNSDIWSSAGRLDNVKIE